MIVAAPALQAKMALLRLTGLFGDRSHQTLSYASDSELQSAPCPKKKRVAKPIRIYALVVVTTSKFVAPGPDPLNLRLSNIYS